MAKLSCVPDWSLTARLPTTPPLATVPLVEVIDEGASTVVAAEAEVVDKRTGCGGDADREEAGEGFAWW